MNWKHRIIIFIGDHLKTTYVLFGILLMLNLPIVFLMWNALFVIASLTKTPRDFRIVKSQDLVKANFLLTLVWICLFFGHGYFVIRYTDFPVVSGEMFPINTDSLWLLGYYGNKFSGYISYNVYQDTLDLFWMALHLFGPFNICLF